MKPEVGEQLKVWEKENARLMKMVVEQTFDREIFMETAKGNW
jgi:hypothetical protein